LAAWRESQSAVTSLSSSAVGMRWSSIECRCGRPNGIGLNARSGGGGGCGRRRPVNALGMPRCVGSWPRSGPPRALP